jgi:hypothetical protein
MPNLRAFLPLLSCLTLNVVVFGMAHAEKSSTLTVVGSAESTGKPKIAYLTFVVVTEGKRAQEPMQANALVVSKVSSALRAQGVAEKDLRTSVNIQPMQDGSPPQAVGFRVTGQTRVLTRIDKVGAVVDAGIAAGAKTVKDVRFDVGSRSEVEAEALAGAVRDAQQRAETLARLAKVKLLGIKSIVAAPSSGDLTLSANVTVVFSIAGER